MRFPCSSGVRHFCLLIGSLLSLAALLSPVNAQQTQSVPATPSAPQPEAPAAPNTFRFDAALTPFYQVSGAANGNFIRQDTTESLGGLASFRQTYRPWLGYELDYGFTRYSEFYNKGFPVQHNTHELTGALLLQTPTPYYGLQLFVTLGTGLMVIAPTSAGGNGQSTQLLPAFVYSVGVNHQVTQHIGIRVQYRALDYKAPNFNNVLIDSHRLRTTMEPGAGVYYRF